MMSREPAGLRRAAVGHPGAAGPEATHVHRPAAGRRCQRVQPLLPMGAAESCRRHCPEQRAGP